MMAVATAMANASAIATAGSPPHDGMNRENGNNEETTPQEVYPSPFHAQSMNSNINSSNAFFGEVPFRVPSNSGSRNLENITMLGAGDAFSGHDSGHNGITGGCGGNGHAHAQSHHGDGGVMAGNLAAQAHAHARAASERNNFIDVHNRLSHLFTPIVDTHRMRCAVLDSERHEGNSKQGVTSARLDRAFREMMQPQQSRENQTFVKLKTMTWTRESHGLFDYESSSIKEKEFHMAKNFNVCRKEMEIEVDEGNVGETLSGKKSEETLARVVSYHGKFWIDRPLPNEQIRQKYSKLWRVVKDVQGGLKLKEGDSIKLGRFKLRVRQLVADDDGNPQGASMAVSSTYSPKVCISSEQPEHNAACRICLMDSSDGNEAEDPLIRPCECKGSIEYIHLDCLRHWINGRLQINMDGNGEAPKGTYFFRPLTCELCKTTYASHLKRQTADGIETEETIVDLPKTKAPYVVLERESHRPEEKGFHVISLADKNRLKLGRGHISDIRFNDVSISRWHATINYNPEKKEFRLEDNDSKFGTLLATKPPIVLDEPLHFQAGRTVLQFYPPKAQDTMSQPDFDVARLESRGFAVSHAGASRTDDFDRFTSADKME